MGVGKGKEVKTVWASADWRIQTRENTKRERRTSSTTRATVSTTVRHVCELKVKGGGVLKGRGGGRIEEGDQSKVLGEVQIMRKKFSKL